MRFGKQRALDLPPYAILLLLLYLSTTHAAAPPAHAPSRHDGTPALADDFICRPVGECLPCPSDQRETDICALYGNRRPVSCIPLSALPGAFRPSAAKERRASQEFPSWEPCARVIKQERADFAEFVLCNVVIAGASLAVVWWRQRVNYAAQYGRLAARIGMPANAMTAGD